MAPAHGARPALSASQRLFFALWPDPAVRAALGHAARGMQRVVDGRRTRDDNLHLTLAFLGEVDIARLAVLAHPPRDVLVPAFGLTLDAWGCWARNGIGWIGPSCPPGAILDLAGNLRSWLGASGFTLERRAFLPHVTLVRDAHCAQLPALEATVNWPVEEFALVRSERSSGGSRYDPIGRWRLR